MNFFDDENRIIKYFHKTNPSQILIMNDDKRLLDVFRKIYDQECWEKWINSSAKDAPPPDYYSNDYKMMMDIMRIDDHAYKNKKGKIINPTNAGESQLRKELEQSGLLDMFPNMENVYVIPKTESQTELDHNFTNYKKNFERTVKEHICKIELYKSNHPGYKIVFFVCDESSEYIEVSGEKPKEVWEGKKQKGKPHLYFLDHDFLNVFKSTGIDYLIWFSPYKLITTLNREIELPQVSVYDANHFEFEMIKYDSNQMISSEV